MGVSPVYAAWLAAAARVLGRACALGSVAGGVAAVTTDRRGVRPRRWDDIVRPGAAWLRHCSTGANVAAVAGERLTPARAAEHEDVVEGSRFIARVRPVGSVEEAEALVTEARRDHPDATHHCWAYKLGEVVRFSDDGEPGGTAGRPMQEVMLKRGLDGCAAVVVRYFGGKKLGAGGLVRAYSGAVARALDAAGVERLTTYHRLRVRAPFATATAVLRELGDAEPGFDAGGLVTEVAVPADEVENLRLRLAELTRGEAVVDVVGAEEGPAREPAS